MNQRSGQGDPLALSARAGSKRPAGERSELEAFFDSQPRRRDVRTVEASSTSSTFSRPVRWGRPTTSRGAHRKAAPRARRRPARRARARRRRPPPAHLVVERLPDPGGRPARPGRGPGPRRDRRHRPQHLRRRAEARRARAQPHLVVIPGEEVKTGDRRGDRALPTEEIPRGHVVRETVEAIRGQGGIVYVPHPFDRLHAIPEPSRCSATSRKSTCSRPTTPPALRGVQRRSAALCAQYDLDGRRVRRTRAPGRRHVRCGYRRSRCRRPSWSASEPRRSCAAHDRSLYLQGTQVGGPGQGEVRWAQKGSSVRCQP